MSGAARDPAAPTAAAGAQSGDAGLDTGDESADALAATEDGMAAAPMEEGAETALDDPTTSAAPLEVALSGAAPSGAALSSAAPPGAAPAVETPPAGGQLEAAGASSSFQEGSPAQTPQPGTAVDEAGVFAAGGARGQPNGTIAATAAPESLQPDSPQADAAGTTPGALTSRVDALPDEALPAADDQRCWLAGPVVDDQLGVELAAAFAEAGINMDLVLQTVEAELEYWVYVPAAATPAERLELSQALRVEGIESFPITEGALAGSQSMGLFRNEERAQAMQERLRRSGFIANIYPRPRYRDEAWIALDDPTRMALGWPGQGGELQDYPGISLRPRDCP